MLTNGRTELEIFNDEVYLTISASLLWISCFTGRGRIIWAQLVKYGFARAYDIAGVAHYRPLRTCPRLLELRDEPLPLIHNWDSSNQTVPLSPDLLLHGWQTCQGLFTIAQ